jgi:phytoene synthase
MVAVSHDAVVELARTRIAQGSKSFALAARLFDARTRDDAMLLYAWCRHCDDEIDGQVLGSKERVAMRRPIGEVLEALRADTLAAVRGTPPNDPVFIGLTRVVETHEIPEEHPLDLIRGMAMDVELERGERTYATLEATSEYCYHVAGVVGVMMAMVMGAREMGVLRRASDLGIAFQMTNIARDVIADAQAGRVYLPADWLVEAGVPPDRVADPDHRRAVADVTVRLLDVAEDYYGSAEAGISRLPFRSAWAVAAARRVYSDIGMLVRRQGATAWDGRAATSKARKIAGIVQAAGDALASRWGGGSGVSRDGLWTPPSLR